MNIIDMIADEQRRRRHTAEEKADLVAEHIRPCISLPLAGRR